MIPRHALGRFTLSCAALAAAVVPGCSPAPMSPVPGAAGTPAAPKSPIPGAEDRNAVAAADDPFGVAATRVVYLPQNWSPADSQRFYFTSQGSQVLPYEWFLALERAEDDGPFRENKNILKYRYLPQNPDPMNPDGLPVGFVRDKGRDRDWLGFNCSACHTGEVRYKGVAYRVDGAPSLADTTGLLRAISASLKATLADAAKFDRFAKKTLVGKDGPVARAALKATMAKVIENRDGYNERNFPPGEVAGNGRIDAFGAILNEIFHHVLPARDSTTATANTKPADAPTSIPFLWDTPQHDLLQWNGSASNSGPANVGVLGRNVGEVIGVFATFDVPENPLPFIGYTSSVQVRNLMAMEEWIKTLWSPQWPSDFPPIETSKKDLGKAVFETNCRSCHLDIDRADPNRKVVAQMKSTGTDPLMSNNFTSRTGKSGKVQGGYSLFFPLAGEKIPADSPGGLVLKNVVIGTIVGSPLHPPDDELTKIELDARRRAAVGVGKGAAPDTLGPKYKARPLNGIWATAPYLHNGSVPSLEALLRPAKDRPKTFNVGSLDFDPVAVGYKQDAKGGFTFRVLDDAGKPIPGNSNEGHEYGAKLSQDDRERLLEYLKSL